MSEPTGLDERLRAALGEGRTLEAPGLRLGADRDATRTRLLAAIRRRRVRRMQAAGVAAAMALGLAVSLSQVLGSAPPPRPVLASPARSDGSAPAQGSTAHRPAAVEPVPALLPRFVAACHLRGRTLDGCGAVVAGSAAPSRSVTAPGNAVSEALGPAGSWAHLGPPLVVRAGTRVVIDLLPVAAERRWGTPSVVATPGHRGSAAAVVVRPVRSPGDAQQFVVVTTKTPVTVVLASKDDVLTGPGSARPTVVGSTAVWALELKVEGT
jgi:hypothetical protein